MTESKSKAGGKREGAGRPAKPSPGVKRQFVIDADLSEWLDSVANKSDIVNMALRELYKKLNLK